MLKFRDDILTFQKGCDFTKSLLESGYLLIIKEESEQDISLIPGQIDFPLHGKRLNQLSLYWYVFQYRFLVSLTLLVSSVRPRCSEKNFVLVLFFVLVSCFGSDAS